MSIPGPASVPPPRDLSAKRVELRKLWAVLPDEAQRKALRSLARLVARHVERREVLDERR